MMDDMYDIYFAPDLNRKCYIGQEYGQEKKAELAEIPVVELASEKRGLARWFKKLRAFFFGAAGKSAPQPAKNPWQQ